MAWRWVAVPKKHQRQSMSQWYSMRRRNVTHAPSCCLWDLYCWKPAVVTLCQTNAARKVKSFCGDHHWQTCVISALCLGRALIEFTWCVIDLLHSPEGLHLLLQCLWEWFVALSSCRHFWVPMWGNWNRVCFEVWTVRLAKSCGSSWTYIAICSNLIRKL